MAKAQEGPELENKDFIKGAEYELSTVQTLMSAVTRIDDKPVTLVEREIGNKEENFVPSISVRSSPNDSAVMIPNQDDLQKAKTELQSYFDKAPTVTANEEEFVPTIFRVGGMTEEMLAKERSINATEEAEAKANKPAYAALAKFKKDNPDARQVELNNKRNELSLEQSPVPDNSAHYISTILHNKPDGTKELVIMDSLGTLGATSDTYKQEINLITKSFKEKFGDNLEVTTNPPGTVFQSDAKSCGPVCLYNLESRLKGETPTAGTLGITDQNGVLKFPAGAEALRAQQQKSWKGEKEIEAELEVLQKKSLVESAEKIESYMGNFQTLKTSHQGAVVSIKNLLGDKDLSSEEKAKALENMKSALTPEILKAYGAKGREAFGKAFFDSHKEQDFTPELNALVDHVDENSKYMRRFNLMESNAGKRGDIVRGLVTDPTMDEVSKKELLGKFAAQSFETGDHEIFQDIIEDIAKKNPVFKEELSAIITKSKEAEAIASVGEQLAQDSIGFGDRDNERESLRTSSRGSAGQNNNEIQDQGGSRRGSETYLNLDLEEAIDPITKAIRERIIAEQKDILKAAMDQRTLSSEEFNEYLKNPENKEAIHKTIDTIPHLQQALQKLEVEGYRAIHNNPDFNFKTVAWDGQKTEDVRTQIVKNAAGEEVCKLTETTVKNPITLAMADGTNKTIKNYRKIDFPLKLEEPNGPMHVSMAVRDENGNKVPESKAVYFTAHYDKQGKLTEVSSPVPLKFAGTGDDAVGYVEREGKIYTLPVTQKNYREMMQQVALNNGHGIDVSQSTSIVAEDRLTLETQRGADVLSRDDRPSLGSGSKITLEEEAAIERRNQLNANSGVSFHSSEDRARNDQQKPLHVDTEEDLQKRAQRREKLGKPGNPYEDLDGVAAMFGDGDNPTHKRSHSEPLSFTIINEDVDVRGARPRSNSAPTTPSMAKNFTIPEAEVPNVEIVNNPVVLDLTSTDVDVDKASLDKPITKAKDVPETVVVDSNALTSELVDNNSQPPKDVRTEVDRIRDNLSGSSHQTKLVAAKEEHLTKFNESKSPEDRIKLIKDIATNDKLHRADKLAILEHLQKQGATTGVSDKAAMADAIITVRKDNQNNQQKQQPKTKPVVGAGIG